MKFKNIAILIFVLLVLDQALKLWVKTSMCLDESIEILPWFHLHFVENNGAAFGMQIANAGGFDWGKLLLSLFRMVMTAIMMIIIRCLWMNILLYHKARCIYCRIYMQHWNWEHDGALIDIIGNRPYFKWVCLWTIVYSM